MPKHEHKFVEGFCECGIFKGLNKKESEKYGRLLDCFVGTDKDFSRLHNKHMAALGVKLLKKDGWDYWR